VPEQLWPIVHVEIPCDEVAPRTVRRMLRNVDSIGPARGDLLLIASELVTNAVVYSGCSEEDVISIRLDAALGHVLLSVSDAGGSGRSAAVAVAEQRSCGGLGLRLVDRLARRWGAERGERYRVWAEVGLTVPLDRNGGPPTP
jgi:two-component sensor histidine kinase